MQRRQFLIKLAKFAAGATAFSATSLSCIKQTRKPNIIYILADDLGYGDLSCYGQQHFQTPNLDRMAAEGMKFTDHYSGSTVCAPSRASLMTGFHTGHCWVRGNYESGPHGFGACLELRPQDATITEIAKQQGYSTGVFGKWGLGVMTTTGQPDKKGVDEFFGYLNQGHAHYFYTDYLWKNGEKVILDGNKEGKREQYTHDLIVDESLDFIKRHKDEPFFLYLPWTIPHAEMLVPEKSIKPFRDKWPEKPYIRKSGYSSQEEPKAAFAGMVTRMDRDVGRVLTLLQKLGLDENTLVMFSSDNGPHHEGGHDPIFFDSNGPLRGHKRDLYEGGIRVPMIARWPGKIKAGSTTNHISAFWDLLPTVCDIMYAAPPKDIDGISFMPTLLGASSEQKNHDYLYWEFHEGRNSSQAVRSDKWKAVRLAPSGPIELYDLNVDIGEQKEIAGENVDIIARMKELLDTTRTPHEIWQLKNASQEE
jgi:arylsulfatase A